MSITASAPKQDDIAFQAALYEHPNATRRGLHTGRRQWVESRIERYLPRGGRAFEVGVGCGIFIRFLAERAESVEAIDINQKFLDGVAAVPGVATRNADATLSLGIGGYDLAVCTEVLEHVPPEGSVAMLRSMAEALNPGGTLILTTPQRFATVELMARLFRFPPVLWLARKVYGTAEELGHINLLTSGALRAQVAQAGLTIEEADLLGFYLPVVAEAGGNAGWTLLSKIGRGLRNVPVARGMLWTQAYVLRKRSETTGA